MEDISSRKVDIEKKLLDEQNKLSMLKDSLTKADSLTNNMVTILNLFDERLHKLEETILPVHRKTKDLQRLQDNIEKTITSLDHVISYHHVAREVEPILRQGPSRQVDRYIALMEKLTKAVAFFQENNPDSPELNTVNQLFSMGKEGLEQEFRGQLNRHTKPIQPDQLLLLKEDAGNQLTVNFKSKPTQGLNSLPEKAVSDLSKIAAWLGGPGNSSGFTSTYAQIRSNNLKVTLLGLKVYIQDRDKLSVAGQRKHSNVKDTPKKSMNRRARILAKGIEGISKGSTYAPIAEEEVIDVEMEPFLEILDCAEKLFKVELNMLQNIIPENRNKAKVFDGIINDSLIAIEQDGMKFVAYAKQCTARHDHPSVVNIFPAIKRLKEKLAVYNDILKVTSESNRLRMPRLISELDSTGSKVLDDFTDSVKSDPEKESNMPKDGTVHELTSNAMLFMQQLAVNLDVAGGILASQQHGVQPSNSKSKRCLAQYTSHVLGALKLNLENKSRVYIDQALAAIFLLNNYNYILSALDREGLLALVQISTPDIENIYKAVIADQRKKYLQSWQKFSAYLSDDNKQGITIHAQPGVKLKDKEKQIVKDKFKSFNNEFDDLVKLHRAWAVPDRKIQAEIKNALLKDIVPMYSSFRERYRMVQFTKNIEKYLKYTPEDIKNLIGLLFDQSTS